MRKELTKRALRQWDSSVPEGLQERIEIKQSRRNFLKTAGIIPAALILSACDNTSSSKGSSYKTNILLQAPWNTFSAVQNHLFPKDNESPGADDINATSYLRSVLALPGTDEEDKKFIRDGVGWINDISQKMFNKDFYLLNNQYKEDVLQRIASSSAGESWLSLLLLYIFEALIVDPVYGGNTNKVGWQWLEHIPGFPMPPENKRYYLLR